MKLLTQEILKKLPKLYETENVPVEEKKVICKFFNPVGQGRWYCLEYSPEDKLFFGYVNLGDSEMAEFGYFSLTEIEEVRLQWSMKIERDLYWDSETTMQQVLDGVRR